VSTTTPIRAVCLFARSQPISSNVEPRAGEVGHKHVRNPLEGHRERLASIDRFANGEAAESNRRGIHPAGVDVIVDQQH
jgi:hypothetical protein